MTPEWERHGGPPEVDDYGVLRWRGHWVGLPMTEQRIMTELLVQPGAVVSEHVFISTGCSEVAVRESIRRLRSRLAPLGLTVARIRKRGYSLQPRIGLPPIVEERWSIS